MRTALQSIIVHIFCFLPTWLIAQQNNTSPNNSLDSIQVITSSAFDDKLRTRTLLQQKDIATIPITNFVDALQYVGGLNLQQRGIMGVQADVSIRGGTSDQTAVFLNGVRMNDPQTGHYVLNLPIQTDDIESIEVNKGGSGRYFGQNAYAGSLVITTKKPTATSLTGGLSYGLYNLLNGSLSGNYFTKKTRGRVSVSSNSSDGYIHNTDFCIQQVFTENYFILNKKGTNDLHLVAGALSKKLGANGFYGLQYPNQYDDIQTYFANTGTTLGNYKVDAFVRYNIDNYYLIRDTPNYYHNTAYTNVVGATVSGEQMVSTRLSFFETAEYRNESVNSNTLGIHNRNFFSINVNANYKIAKQFDINAGGGIASVSNYHPFFIGGINLGYRLTSISSIYIAYNNSYCVPTYTNLYYLSPIQSGNSNLRPEISSTVEAGWKKLLPHNFSTDLNVYYRAGSNQIDWVKLNQITTTYTAENIATVNTMGAEVTITKRFSSKHNPLKNLNLQYHYNYIDYHSPLYSMYIMSNLKQQVILRSIFNWMPRLQHSIVIRVEQRANLTYTYALVDSKIEYQFGIPISVYVSANNIFNTHYENFTGLVMPGVWVYSGVKFSLSKHKALP